MAAGEEGSSPSAGEVEPPPKQKRPQRRAATSRKTKVDQSGDEIEGGDSEEREDDADPIPTKSRKKVAENGSGTKAKTMQKSKKAGSSNVGFTAVQKNIDCSSTPRQKSLMILKSERSNTCLGIDPF